MRLVSLLAVVAAIWVAVWAVEVLLGLPGAIAVSNGALLTLAVLVFSLVVIVGSGIGATTATRTTYW